MEKYLVVALIAAFGTYAARVGLALAAYSKKHFAFTVAGYGVLFLFSGLMVSFLDKSFGLSSGITGKAVYLHVFVAVGLLLWALFAYEHDKAGKILLFPCPFCLMTIVFSFYVLKQLTHLSVSLLVAFSFSLFLSVMVLFYFLGRLFRIEVSELMLGVGVYYLILIGASRYYAETRRVYAMVSNMGFKLPEEAVFLLLFAGAVVAFGFYRGRSLGG